MYKIGFVGNFTVPYTTECEREWSFKKLGHEVIRFQENQTTAAQLLEAKDNLDLLIYSHTHDPSYVIADLIDVFKEYKEAGIPTASAHLDRWLWLDRVKDVGQEATWFTEYTFMADCSPEAVELYDKLNLNWHYLKPGVVEKDCYLAKPDHGKYPHEIVFTGSKGYHPEYPFRPQLVDFLHKTYGDKFGHYGGDGIRVLRQDDLNTMLASSKIVVGDSCFGGRPNYVSDRYYETRGRGGFLLHPKTEGVDDYGVAHYQQASLQDLKQQIDYYLENPDEAEANRKEGFNWVRKHETYTQRSQEMLDIIFRGKE